MYFDLKKATSGNPRSSMKFGKSRIEKLKLATPKATAPSRPTENVCSTIESVSLKNGNVLSVIYNLMLASITRWRMFPKVIKNVFKTKTTALFILKGVVEYLSLHHGVSRDFLISPI